MKKIALMFIVLFSISIFLTGCAQKQEDPLVGCLTAMNKSIAALSDNDKTFAGYIGEMKANILDLYAKILESKTMLLEATKQIGGAQGQMMRLAEVIKKLVDGVINHKEAILSLRERLNDLEARVGKLDGKRTREVETKKISSTAEAKIDGICPLWSVQESTKTYSDGSTFTGLCSVLALTPANTTASEISKTAEVAAEVTAEDFKTEGTVENPVQNTSETALSDTDDIPLHSIQLTVAEQALCLQGRISEAKITILTCMFIKENRVFEIGMQLGKSRKSEDTRLQKLMDKYHELERQYLIGFEFSTFNELKTAADRWDKLSRDMCSVLNDICRLLDQLE